MGARTARLRIQAADFLIPPEFRGLRLTEHSAGQIGGLRLSLADSGGRTVLGGCYQQVPLRILPPFSFPGEPASLLYLLNPTAGLMNGDGHLLEIEAGPGTRVVIAGQSANRIHPATSSFSTQQWHVRVARGAQVVILPGPNIPFRGSRYFQSARVDLEEGAQFLWGDIWTPGRYARDGSLAERYQFDRIVQELEVRREGELIYRDRFDWQGPWDETTARWYLGDVSHPGTAGAGLFATGPVPAPDRDRPPPNHGSRSFLPLAHGDTLIRWCGPAPWLTRDVVTHALRLAAAWSRPDDPSPTPWLISTNNLGPSHWFSNHAHDRE